MKLPLKLHKLTNQLENNWNQRFKHNPIREGVWRRHQDPSNHTLSGWSFPKDNNKKIIHYRDEYGISDGYFTLKTPYLYYAISSKDLNNHHSKIIDSLSEWKKKEDSYVKDDLTCKLNYNDTTLSLTIHATSYKPSKKIKERPWKIFNLGIRDKLNRGQPRYGCVKDIVKYLPACVELGCGPSIETGVLPLNYLHDLYSVMRKDKTFIFNCEDDKIYKFLSNPKETYLKTSKIHVTCLKAEPNSFYTNLKNMIDKKRIFEPIFTNNFDRICLSLGIKENYLREYDKIGIYPNYQFPKDCKSLLVIGSHADRRGVQKSAREQGKKIIFIDTEGYHTENDFIPYPLESPQNNDLIINCKSSIALEKLCEY